MNLLNKQSQPVKSKSPVTSSVDFNFKQLLQQYQQTLASSQNRLKSQEKQDEPEVNGFKTERSVLTSQYVIVHLYDRDRVMELKFDSAFGTTDQLLLYLKSQCTDGNEIFLPNPP